MSNETSAAEAEVLNVSRRKIADIAIRVTNVGLVLLRGAPVEPNQSKPISKGIMAGRHRINFYGIRNHPYGITLRVIFDGSRPSIQVRFERAQS